MLPGFCGERAALRWWGAPACARLWRLPVTHMWWSVRDGGMRARTTPWRGSLCRWVDSLGHRSRARTRTRSEVTASVQRARGKGPNAIFSKRRSVGSSCGGASEGEARCHWPESIVGLHDDTPQKWRLSADYGSHNPRISVDELQEATTLALSLVRARSMWGSAGSASQFLRATRLRHLSTRGSSDKQKPDEYGKERTQWRLKLKMLWMITCTQLPRIACLTSMSRPCSSLTGQGGHGHSVPISGWTSTCGMHNLSSATHGGPVCGHIMNTGTTDRCPPSAVHSKHRLVAKLQGRKS